MKEAVSTSQTANVYHTTQRNFPEEGQVYHHYSQNQKSINIVPGTPEKHIPLFLITLWR
jgi:hypothetical protein